MYVNSRLRTTMINSNERQIPYLYRIQRKYGGTTMSQVFMPNGSIKSYFDPGPDGIKRKRMPWAKDLQTSTWGI